jgi:cobalt-zinc-cadmium efflux system outer membrane protein
MNMSSHRYRLLLVAILLPSVSAVLRAQDPVAADTLLARLTSEALATNPSLDADRAMARAAESRIRPAGALPDPMLSTGVMDLTLPHFGFRQSDFTEVDVELSQEFPWPGTLGARTRAARADAAVRRANVAARRREIVVRTAELYYKLRYLVSARLTLQRQRALLATSVDIATTRYATASVSQSDPLQARVALARLDSDDADLAAQESSVRADLGALRDVRGRDSLVIAPINPDSLETGVHGDSMTAPLPDSLENHPRLVARRAATEAAEQTARVEQLGGRPDFTITTRYGARPLGSDFFTAFVGLRLPLWAGRKQGRLAEAARADADAARAEEREEAAALGAELRDATAQVTSGRRRLHLLIAQVIPAAQAGVDAAQRGYRLGQVDFQSALSAEDSLYRARLEATMVAAEHFTHLVMLEQLTLEEEIQ